MFNKHVIYKALIYEPKVLFVDRHLVLCLLLFCVCISAISFSLLAVSLCVIYFVCGYYCLYLMGKKDIKLRQVYMRYIKYKAYYRAQAHALDENRIKY